MKILFVNTTLGDDYSALDIAITQLATYVNCNEKHTAEICDLTFHRKNWVKHLNKHIEKFKPDICGISCNTLYLRYNKMVANAIKQKNNIPIIFGGYHTSIYPEKTLKYKSVDYICIGDGEKLIVDLLNNLKNKNYYPDIPGLGYKRNSELVINPGGSFIEDINSLPTPDWDLWEDLEKYFYFLGMLYVIGTRGCPYKCTYCDAHGISNAVKGNYYRIISPKKYVEQLNYYYEKYKDKNLRLFQMFDQVLTLDKKWVKEFCEEYIKIGLHKKIKFSTFSRIDNLDKDKIEMLGNAGCALLRVGIEAGNDFIRNEVYKKKISKEKIREIFKLCKAKNIGFTAFFMIGGPAENSKTINETINFAYELDANRSAFFIFKPFTEEGRLLVKKYGGKINDNLWNSADNITFGVAVESPELKAWKVEYYQKKAYFFTFGRRLLRMLFKLKFKYFFQILIYIIKGIYCGLGVNYLITYYHIYAYDNVDK